MAENEETPFDEKFRIAICAFNNVPADHVLSEHQCSQGTKEAWVRVFDAIAAMQAWQPIEGAVDIEPFKGYLVQHQNDLYPVTAYLMPGEGWFYLQDGPEDVIEPGDHQHTPLKRAPTHYRGIMNCPLVEAEALGMPLPPPPEASP